MGIRSAGGHGTQRLVTHVAMGWGWGWVTIKWVPPRWVEKKGVCSIGSHILKKANKDRRGEFVSILVACSVSVWVKKKKKLRQGLRSWDHGRKKHSRHHAAGAILQVSWRQRGSWGTRDHQRLTLPVTQKSNAHERCTCWITRSDQPPNHPS